jgi:outer membrane protein TolC
VVIPAADLAAARRAVVTLWPWEPDAERPMPYTRPRPVPEGGWFAEALGEPPE